MVQKEDEQGMVSPPQVVSNEIKKILALNLPCEGLFAEFPCDKCPWDILPKSDCGLAILQARARMLKLEMI